MYSTQPKQKSTCLSVSCFEFLEKKWLIKFFGDSFTEEQIVLIDLENGYKHYNELNCILTRTQRELVATNPTIFLTIKEIGGEVTKENEKEKENENEKEKEKEKEISFSLFTENIQLKKKKLSQQSHIDSITDFYKLILKNQKWEQSKEPSLQRRLEKNSALIVKYSQLFNQVSWLANKINILKKTTKDNNKFDLEKPQINHTNSIYFIEKEVGQNEKIIQTKLEPNKKLKKLKEKKKEKEEKKKILNLQNHQYFTLSDSWDQALSSNKFDYYNNNRTIIRTSTYIIRNKYLSAVGSQVMVTPNIYKIMVRVDKLKSKSQSNIGIVPQNSKNNCYKDGWVMDFDCDFCQKNGKFKNVGVQKVKKFDVIKIILNLSIGTLHFYLNNDKINYAFNNLDLNQGYRLGIDLWEKETQLTIL
ncbi:hypothetical protein M0812_00982 [Anaeramoeba flamelloides]|uniref:SPRY domain-containing protein n=1 Tax=Anaeramoeba flamelloides TaxID=1746091 RepID=A0AAV8A6W9_9EUKA|nr:hypothetical protein M0812_00982 [Anaeramoeba flamelloides]